MTTATHQVAVPGKSLSRSPSPTSAPAGRSCCCTAERARSRPINALEPVTRVRIFNTNAQALIVAEVPVRDGRAGVMGDLAIPGVPGTGAEIVMNWVATIGAKTGHLLPTGRAVDEITLETGATVQATLCDAGNACVWVLAEELGRTGSELAEEINEDADLIGIVREIRGKAAYYPPLDQGNAS